MLKDIYENRRMIFKLAKNDFKTRYAGSVFGTVWAFVQPLVTIAVYYFVFGYGLKGGTDTGSEVPFVLYLVSGIVPWFYFQEGWMNGTSSLLEYSYLIKKVVFNINVLPVPLYQLSAVWIFWMAAGFILSADSVLLPVTDHSSAGTVLYHQCSCGALPGSWADHQHWTAGWCVADSDYVRTGGIL